MSTKIYNGKLIPTMTLRELNEFRKSLKLSLLPIAYDQWNKMAAHITQSVLVYVQTGVNICQYNVDMTKITDTDSDAVLYFAKNALTEMIKKTSDAILACDCEMDADFDVSICIFPLEDKTLCIPQANNNRLMETLLKNPTFSDYSYWNNTDQPNDITNDEWNERKKNWKEALPGLGIPKEHGIVINILDAKYDLIPYNGDFGAIMNYMIPDDELTKKVARHVVRDMEWARLVREYEAECGKMDFRAPYIKMLRQSQEYEAKHPEVVEEYERNLRRKIKTKELYIP